MAEESAKKKEEKKEEKKENFFMRLLKNKWFQFGAIVTIGAAAGYLAGTFLCGEEEEDPLDPDVLFPAKATKYNPDPKNVSF